MYGQLGNGDDAGGDIANRTKDKNAPVPIGSGTWKAVAGGKIHSLALKSDGTLWAWGDNTNGQIGVAPSTVALGNTPRQVGTSNDWKAIAGGSAHSLALNNAGTLYAWGSNALGQLGDNSNTKSNAPKAITGTWKAITARRGHTLAINSAGVLHAWGWNAHGQLGDGTTAQRNSPKLIPHP